MSKKRMFCIFFIIAFIMPEAALSADNEIDYPHYMSRMEVSDFGDDFKALGKNYTSHPILTPYAGGSPDDHYNLYKYETNNTVVITSDGLASNEDLYETLVNAVEAYFGASSAQFVRDNFDYTQFNIATRNSEEIGDYSFSLTYGNNHRGYSITIKRTPIFLDMIDLDADSTNVIHLYGEGIIQGVGGNMFAPNDNITRAQFAVIFSKIIGVKAAEYQGLFTDVTAGQYYTGAVEALADLGYIKGYDSGQFHPDNPISNQDMYLIAYRYLNENDLLPPGWGTNITISDFYEYDDYVRQAIDVLYARSMVNNWETPRDPAKRIGAANFLCSVKFYAEGIRSYYEQSQTN